MRLPSILRFTALLGFTAGCSQQPQHQVHHYQRILICGNSITRHPPLPSIGWFNDWGMAASKRENDFVHLLEHRFQQETPGAQVDFYNIAEWERTYSEYDLSRLDTLRTEVPDLLILRIGENVPGDSLVEHEFNQHFSALISRLAGPKTRVLVAGPFWAGNPAEELMKQHCAAEGIQYLPLAELEKNPANKAIGKFANGGVANHPSDAGHAAIAEVIWQNI